MINDRLQQLADYPFARLAALLDGVAPAPGAAPLNVALGEPQFAAPPLLAEAIAANAQHWNRYPPANGTEELRGAIADWLTGRYALPPGMIDADRAVLPLSGTREGLFQAALVAVPTRKDGARPAALLPNPFYAAYLGAATLAGAEPVLLDATAATGHLPDLDALDPALLRRTAIFYLCSPSNPQGAVADRAYLARLIGLARHYDFVLALDECYAEIYDSAPPPGGLEAAEGRLDRLLVFHSLSKRSSAPGLRSGFVAGDPALIAGLRRLRGYGAAGMPLPVQAASAALWRDQDHVAGFRARYRATFDAAERALAPLGRVRRPAGGFFLWLEVGDSETTARRLWAEVGIRVLPGAYLGRPGGDGRNPGAPYLRLALVHGAERVAAALERAVELLGDGVPAAAAGSADARPTARSGG